MKYTLVFKTPDVMDQLEPLYEKSSNTHDYNEVLECPHNDEVDSLKKFIEEYVEYGEYVKIEFDTDEGIVRVLKI